VRILFVHEVNYLNKVIFEMHEFPELLALRGHRVSFFHYPEAPDRPRVSLRAKTTRISGRVYPDAEIDLITPPTFGGSRVERYFAPLLASRALRREIRCRGYDVIVLYSVPTTGWQTVAFAKRAGVPVVFRALDVSHKIRRSFVGPLVRVAEKYIYRNVALLSANNPAMADYCVELSGRTGPTVVNVPPVDFLHFEEQVEADLHGELGLPRSAKVVLYMGTFFSFSGLDVVIAGMVEEFKRYPDLRLVLVGGGDFDKTLRDLVAQLGVSDRVIFTGVVPYAKLPQYLKLADVAINPFRPELLTHVALPHKVLQYMAAGVPTVSTSLRGLRGVLGEGSGVTWVDGPDGVASVASALAREDPSALAAISRAQLDCVRARFSKETAVAAFEEALTVVGRQQIHD
jgi:glycosyltransferase involved in cell wall biosynthesis